MSGGNILFLVCGPCEQANEKDFGVKLCERGVITWYEPLVPPKQFKDWLAKHSKCAGRYKPDHFRLALLREPNYDQPAERPKPQLEVVN